MPQRNSTYATLITLTVFALSGCSSGAEETSGRESSALTVPKLAVTVCASDCDYQDIQSAIDGAVSVSVIRVYRGSYAGPLVISRALTLRGDGPRDVIVSNGLPVVRVACPDCDVRIEGFAFTDGGGDSCARSR